MTELPLFYWWCERDLYRGYGWRFGFFLAPWPREEQEEGGMLYALFMLDGFVSSRGGSRLWWLFADPANRPIPHKDNSHD